MHERSSLEETDVDQNLIPLEDWEAQDPRDFGVAEPEKPAQVPRYKVISCILLWYAFSIILSVYNKYMFSDKGLNFKFPVITTAFHQLVQTCLAYICIKIWGIKQQQFTIKDMANKVFPCALASSGDIGMGNLSLVFVTLSFYTMVKSSSLGFVLLFSILFKLEHISWALAGIISMITVGVLMMVAGETQFHLLGFILVLSASCASGLRWALTKVFLQGGKRQLREKPNPVQTIMLFSPFMFVILIIWGLIMEGPKRFATAAIWQQHNIVVSLILVLIPGVFAYGLVLTEFALLNYTGPLTLSVAGICKEVATIIVSVVVFHDELTLVNGLGLLVTIVSIFGYHRLRTVEAE